MRFPGFGPCALGIYVAAAMLVAGCGGHTGGSEVPQIDGYGNTLPHHHTFNFTGGRQSFEVPAGVKSIKVIARGAVGGGDYNGYGGGRGGRVHAVIPVRPGETLYVFVGGAGSSNTDTGGFNGGALGGAHPYCHGSYCYGYGGGGASDVREDGNSLEDRIVVAGGGGGAGSCDVVGGGGGGKIGGNGDGGGGHCGSSHFYSGGGGGDGGTQNHGGSGGAGEQGQYGDGGSGNSGTLGTGGSGGQAGYSPYCHSSCFGGGAGGGAGGGYYGGGGGGGGNAGVTDYQYIGGLGGGGGGGSSYAEPSAKSVQMWQNWHNATGNGLVVFSW